MSLARNITPPTPDAPISEPAEPQKINAPVCDIAEGRAHYTGDGHRQLSSWRKFLLAVQRWRAPVWIPRNLLVAMSAIVLLLLLAFAAYAFRRPASPLAPGALLLNQNVKQNTPFGPVTITPSAALSKPSPVPPANTAPAVRPTTPKPSAARRRADLHRRLPEDLSTAKQQSE